MALLDARAPLTRVLGRRDAGEFDEVANQVRLIEVAAPRRELRPLRCRLSASPSEGTLKTLHAQKQLWRHPNLGAEDFDESAMTETDAVGYVGDGGAAFSEVTERNVERASALQRPQQMRVQRRFEQPKPPLGGRRCAQAFAQAIDVARRPQRLELDVPVGEAVGCLTLSMEMAVKARTP